MFPLMVWCILPLTHNLVRSRSVKQQVLRIFIVNSAVNVIATLRRHGYSNIPKILPPKNEIFQMKNSDISHISAQTIDCGYS